MAYEFVFKGNTCRNEIKKYGDNQSVQFNFIITIVW